MPDIPEYDPQTIETKWQQTWDEERAFAVRDDLPRDRCYYVLEMFPYPSGKLHMGHVRNYSIGDAAARYQRLRGKHVLHPMGWDSFGLPAEQAAIDNQRHPREWTYANIDHMRGQLKRMGFSYDWSREFATSDPGYAHREQLLFLDLVDKGLVYRKNATVNWSTGLNTVLANEQVVDGLCWRTGMPVIQKELPQWFVRTTAYAQELLDDIESLTDWPDAVKIQQRNWIGRSVGAEIDFRVKDHDDVTLTVFTTRPDTIFGVTFMSIAPEHELVDRIITDEQRAAIHAFRDELASQSNDERLGEAAEKKGVFTGAYAINPVNGRAVPIYAANFVLADYGTGVVMAVPGHDTRDFAFAKAYDLPIITVIQEDGTDASAPLEAAFTDVGTMVNSGPFDGTRSDVGKSQVTAWLAEQGYGREQITWRLRDWLISRQRYWGNPIPFAYGETQGVVPLKPTELPVTLPDDVVFDGTGNPLQRHASWHVTANDGQPLTVQTANGREPATRETDTMDTFVESSWYQARFTCADADAPLDPKRVDHWLPVDLYIGGIEHAVMHLLYARFFQKALADCGHTSVREPFKRLLCQGMVCKEHYYRQADDGKKTFFSPDDVDVEQDAKGAVTAATLKADGQPVIVGPVVKMSKSLKNGVDPKAIIDAYGADTARLFTLFAAPPEKSLEWNENGVAGCYRFLKRLWTFAHANFPKLAGCAPYPGRVADLTEAHDQALLRKVHATVKRATIAMETNYAFNTTIAACMELFNALDADHNHPQVLRCAFEALLLLLSPFTPHICEELWDALDCEGTMLEAGWPTYDETELTEATFEYPVQVKGKLKAKIHLPSDLTGADLEAAAMAHPDVIAILDGQSPRKIICVPKKIINLVV